MKRTIIVSDDVRILIYEIHKKKNNKNYTEAALK